MKILSRMMLDKGGRGKQHFKKLPDCEPDTKRKKTEVIQLALPDLDKDQQRGKSSS